MVHLLRSVNQEAVVGNSQAASLTVDTEMPMIAHDCVKWGTSSSERISLTLHAVSDGNLPRLEPVANGGPPL